MHLYFMYTKSLSFIKAISIGDVALTSLRIGEFANVNKYHAIVRPEFPQKPLEAVSAAPSQKQCDIASLLLFNGAYPDGNSIHRLSLMTVVAFIKYGMRVSCHNIEACMRSGVDRTNSVGRTAVLLTFRCPSLYDISSQRSVERHLNFHHTERSRTLRGFWYSFRYCRRYSAT